MRSHNHHLPRWVDWAGMVAWLLLAAGTWSRAGGLGLFMLPVFLGELLLSASFLLRRPPRRRLGGLQPQIVAYLCTFMIPAFVLLSATWFPQLIRITSLFPSRALGFVLWFFAITLLLWPLWHLRTAFSIEPAARHLIRTGPYRWVRHPMYGVHLLNYLGLLLERPTPVHGAVFFAWLLLLRLRIRYEEQVLAEAFPEYTQYQRSTGALFPRLS